MKPLVQTFRRFQWQNKPPTGLKIPLKRLPASPSALQLNGSRIYSHHKLIRCATVSERMRHKSMPPDPTIVRTDLKAHRNFSGDSGLTKERGSRCILVPHKSTTRKDQVKGTNCNFTSFVCRMSSLSILRRFHNCHQHLYLLRLARVF